MNVGSLEWSDPQEPGQSVFTSLSLSISGFTTISLNLDEAESAGGGGFVPNADAFQIVISMDSAANSELRASPFTYSFDHFKLEVIPEPSTYAAIFGALAMTGYFIRRRLP